MGLRLKDVLTEATLKKLYWDEGLSLVRIGNKFGVSQRTVHNYMKRYGIPRRSYSEAGKGREISLETRRRMGAWQVGRTLSDETREKISATRKAGIEASRIIPWNKGKKLPPLSEKRKQEIGLFFKGRKQSEEHVEKRVAAYKDWYAQNKDFFDGDKNPFYGKTHSLESREKMSFSQLGEKNHRWLGGSSYKDYPLEFNDVLKRKIRERDEHTCQICGEFGGCVHHIDYDKNNNHPDNLTTLCKSDHIRTNSNRMHWIKFFNRKSGGCYLWGYEALSLP